MKKLLISFFATALSFGSFAQLPQLRPEVVELYRLQDIAKQSRTLNSDDLIATHEAFFNHPLFCKTAFGIEYINLAEALLIQGKHEKAEMYFLKSASLHHISTSNMFTRIFNKASNALEIAFNKPNDKIWDTIFIVPRTPENMKFKEMMLGKILEVENSRIVDPRIIVIAQEIKKMAKADQHVRIDSGSIWWEKLDSIERRQVIEFKKKNLSEREVDSMNVYRIIELIRENPDIDVLRILRGDKFDLIGIIFLHSFRLNVRYARVAWTDFFEPYWRKQAENGKGLEYCYWYDFYCWFIKRQLPYYGAYNMSAFYPYDEDIIEDIEKMNERRERIGLLPIPTINK